MITEDNFKKLLKEIGFKQSGNIFTKEYEAFNASLKADFKKKKLFYPEEQGLKVNERQTCNFKSNENFVVFECVDRLLSKGYKPEHIELEPKWKVGHGASGGRADILIKDNSGKSLLIIECKTEGKELNDAWRQTLNKPTQLFSYAQQVRSTDFICLYSSDLVGNITVAKYYLITLKDNEKLLEELKDSELLSYKNAEQVEDIWNAWKSTYKQDFSTKGVFEEDIQPYAIGKKKFTVNDLSIISSNDIQGKYHEFATILRQHNVSGRENAFDKLVNLFLCKIVDETQNVDDLHFYWKGIAYDSPFDLQDRLQKLYQSGMKEFLGEDVTYIDNKAIDDAFRFFKNDPDSTRDTIKKYFRQLKFFTNNDFAFIDVHNEKLFYQNSAVLLKMVQMLQDIRLKTDEQNQFLGDMFEGFLDQGIKQSEGQYFTPMPIVKFILNSLPIEDILNKSEDIPKVIDYACGAGHFLNEYAQQIQAIIQKKPEQNPKDYYREVIGIEKEYRLSKVAKVSAFMYGQDEVDIIYSDALSEQKKVKDGTFSLLVANPPYSVKGFLETLTEKDRKRYRLIETINEKSYSNNNSIEAFFIERAKQLLKPGGCAGIIVPSSILSRGSSRMTSTATNVFVGTREILIKYFDIVAIAEHGSGTFGKTGTNTVTLFLRRKSEDPAPAEHYFNRVNDWFTGEADKDKIFQDEHFIDSYCEHLDIESKDYKTLLKGKPNESLLNTDLFLEYKVEFDKWSIVKNRKKQKAFKDKAEEDRKVELYNLFTETVQTVEKEKLYYFILASLAPSDVVIVNSPSKTADLRKFLGYEWSSAKGNEGIKYLGGVSIPESATEEEEVDGDLEEDDKRILSNMFNLENINTPLYDPQNSANPNKINYLISSNFQNSFTDIPKELKDFVSTVPLVDMINFNLTSFNKGISLSGNKKLEIETKWDLVRIKDVAEIVNGGTPDTTNPSYWKNGTICWATLVDTKSKYLDDTERKITQLGVENSSARLLPVNSVIFSSRATIGEVCINNVETTTNQGYKNFICDPKRLNYEYLYYLLEHLRPDIENLIPQGTKYKEISKTTISNWKIPIPPIKTQDTIVIECRAIDDSSSQMLSSGIKMKDLPKEMTERKKAIFKRHL